MAAQLPCRRYCGGQWFIGGEDLGAISDGGRQAVEHGSGIVGLLPSAEGLEDLRVAKRCDKGAEGVGPVDG